MKHASNKSNISIIRDYLAGERPFVQVGYKGDSDKYRKDGEKWTDKDGIEWQRKDGKNVRLTKSQADFIRELITEKCKCGQVIKWGSRLDEYFFRRTGMCENCLIDYETKLRILGVYDDYEKYKLSSYELGTLKDMKTKIEETIAYFSKDSGDITAICNAEGFTERWSNTNSVKILEDAKKDLQLVRKRIADITKIRKSSKKKYQEGVTQYKLEFYA